jgi:hypothetical protein
MVESGRLGSRIACTPLTSITATRPPSVPPWPGGMVESAWRHRLDPPTLACRRRRRLGARVETPRVGSEGAGAREPPFDSRVLEPRCDSCAPFPQHVRGRPPSLAARAQCFSLSLPTLISVVVGTDPPRGTLEPDRQLPSPSLDPLEGVPGRPIPSLASLASSRPFVPRMRPAARGRGAREQEKRLCNTKPCDSKPDSARGRTANAQSQVLAHIYAHALATVSAVHSDADGYLHEMTDMPSRPHHHPLTGTVGEKTRSSPMSHLNSTYRGQPTTAAVHATPTTAHSGRRVWNKKAGFKQRQSMPSFLTLGMGRRGVNLCLHIHVWETAVS